MASSSSLTLSQAILSRSTIPRHGSSQQLHPSSALSIPSFSGLKSTSSSAVPSLSRRRAAAVVRLPVRASAAVETLEKTTDTELVESPSTPLRKNSGNIFLTYPSHGLLSAQTRPSLPPCSGHNQGKQAKGSLQIEEKTGRRLFLTFLAGFGTLSTALPSLGKTKKQNPYDERRLLEQNKRIQRENNVPDDFPNFVREGFTVKVVTPDYYVTHDSGLVVWDIEVGKGDCPKDGQQVTFHYIGYNESGRRIDSTYLQGSPAKVRLGTNGLIPGFEEGIKDMKPGGKRRMIIPPELGPPVGPSTFFSSKQFEVFDVELLSIQDCTRRTIGFYSDVVCG